MERKLFLTSAGLPKETRNYFINLLPKDPKDCVVAFIPTAAYPEVDKSFVKISLDELKEIGITKIKEVDLKNEDKNSLLSKLKDCDVIYVNGGNTFYLLGCIRKSGFNEIIRELLDEGKIYMGVSAGSMVAGPNIESAGWKHVGEPDVNIVHLENLEGLNLVPFEISPHFVENDRTVLEERSKSVDYPIIVLNDTQAVLCIGNKYKIVGEGEKITFNKNCHV